MVEKKDEMMENLMDLKKVESTVALSYFVLVLKTGLMKVVLKVGKMAVY